MSKPKLVVSLAMALATLVAARCWAAQTFRLMAPPAYSTERVAFGVAQQTAGRPAIAFRLSLPSGAQIKAPVPGSMPAPALAKKNRVKGNVETVLEVDASGSVAGVREMYPVVRYRC